MSSTVKGNVVKVLEPKALTLVGTPANQRSFSIIRSDQGENTVATNSTTPKNVVRRQRRSDAQNPILSVSFPEGTSLDAAATTLDTFGLSGFTVAEDGGKVVAKRSDATDSNAPTSTIVLTPDGITAQVKRSDSEPAATSGKIGVAVAAVEIDLTRYEEDQITEVLQRFAIDFTEDQLDNSANDKSVLRRFALEEGQETRSIEVEPGIVAVITRADADDIPDGFVLAVKETAYGSYGWGHLDFAAALADRDVSRQIDDAVYMFRDVVDNILFWSPLTLEARKTLTRRASDQFADYIVGLLDTLPRQTLIAINQRADKPATKQESPMSATNTAPAASAASSDNQSNVNRNDASADAGKANDAGSEIVSMTRADLDAAIAAAVAAAQVQRSDKAPAAAEPETATASAEGEAGKDEGNVTLTRSDLQSIVAGAVSTALKESAQVIVRSDRPDAVFVPADSKQNVKRSDSDIFRGAIPGLRASGN